MLEWLEQLGYDTESRQTVVRSRLGFAIRRLKDPLSVNPAVNGYIFSNQGRMRQQGMGSAFHQLCARYNGLKSPLPLRLLGYGKPLHIPVISNTNNSILIFYHNYEMKTEGCVATVREWLAKPLLLLVLFFPEKRLKIFYSQVDFRKWLYSRIPRPFSLPHHLPPHPPPPSHRSPPLSRENMTVKLIFPAEQLL